MSSGALVFLKPPGMTSHDAVAWARRFLGQRRVGHAGTLDPLAAGVLVLLVGRATGAARYFSALPKRYRAEVIFGLETDSGDLDGVLLRRQPCPHLTPGQVEAALAPFRGRIRQKPPAYAAVKVGGEPAYRRARKGEAVELPEREVEVYRLELAEWHPDPQHPRALLEVDCSAGTYMRSLARDLGQALGTGGCLGFLLRTAVGPFSLASAWTREELEEARAQGRELPLVPLAQALSFLPAVVLDPAEARAVAAGRLPGPVGLRVCAAAAEGEAVRLLDPAGALVATARRRGGSAELERVFAPSGRERA